MLELDQPAITAFFPARKDYFAVANSADGCPPPGGEIHPVMRAVDLEDGMGARVGEKGANPRKLQRKAQEGARHGSPFEIVVARFALSVLEVNGHVLLACAHELSRHNMEQ